MKNHHSRIVTQLIGALAVSTMLCSHTSAQNLTQRGFSPTTTSVGLLGDVEADRVSFAPQEFTQSSTSGPDWQQTFGPGAGVTGIIRAFSVFDDGTGEALFAGGDFQFDGIPYEGMSGSSSIAKWDGETWAELGTGTNGGVLVMTVFDDGNGEALYVGGSFTTVGFALANGVGKWDGSNWSGLGTGVLGPVSALTVFDDGSGPALFVGGKFSDAGGSPASNIAKWDGTTWSSLASGIAGGSSPVVSSLTVFDDGGGAALYAGGRFATAGGGVANNIAKWDGATWSSIGSGIEGGTSAVVPSLAVFDDGNGSALYAGGQFTTAGGMAANNVAKFDGSNWSSLGSGVDAPVSELKVFDDGGGGALFVGGLFQIANGAPASGIARWDGSDWAPLDSGIASEFTSFPLVDALAVYDSGDGEELFIGGFFGSSGGLGARNIAAWNGSNWSPMFGASLGPDRVVNAATVFDDGAGAKLYSGGQLTLTGGFTTNRIASWDGKAWAQVGSGMDNTVRALLVFDDGSGDELYAGGFFTQADGVAVNQIAKWDGASWATVGAGMNDTVYALAEFDDGSGTALYAGGQFTTADGVAANRIAKWDGANWTPLGIGLNDDVLTLTVFDDGSGPALYAGGFFTSAGAVAAAGVARWDGTSWSSLGSGVSSTQVNALTVFDDGSGAELIVGGQFTVAGGMTANRIAKWNGTSWSTLGIGMDGNVSALGVFDDGLGSALFAGGNFNSAGAVQASNIAKWDGNSWAPLGSGTDKNVRSLTVFDDGNGEALYVGGNFTDSGGLSAYRMAKWGTANSSLGALTSDVSSVSLGTGGQQLLALDSGATQAGWFYFVFGSVTGTTPGIDFGSVNLPLNFDVFFNLTLFNPGLAAFGNYRGTLDGMGQAQSTFSLPALMDVSLIGVTINHAYLAGSVYGITEFASNAVDVTLVP